MFILYNVNYPVRIHQSDPERHYSSFPYFPDHTLLNGELLKKKDYVQMFFQRFWGQYYPIIIEDKNGRNHACQDVMHLKDTLFERSIAYILNVVAHEYGHLYLGHTPQQNPFNLEHINQLFEIEADIFSAISLALNHVSIQPSIDHFSKVSETLKMGRVHLKSGCRVEILQHHYDYAMDFLQNASIPELIQYVKAAAFYDFQHYSLDPSNFGDIHPHFNQRLRF